MTAPQNSIGNWLIGNWKFIILCNKIIKKTAQTNPKNELPAQRERVGEEHTTRAEPTKKLRQKTEDETT
jgi:hypothetical protein